MLLYAVTLLRYVFFLRRRVVVTRCAPYCWRYVAVMALMFIDATMSILWRQMPRGCRRHGLRERRLAFLPLIFYAADDAAAAPAVPLMFY